LIEKGYIEPDVNGDPTHVIAVKGGKTARAWKFPKPVLNGTARPRGAGLFASAQTPTSADAQTPTSADAQTPTSADAALAN
jgi:hypothetical protein